MRKALVFKIILVVFLFGFAFGTSFLVTSFLDKDKFTNPKLLVTFEDSREFNLENLQKQKEEEALTNYPYIFTIENKSNTKTNFNIKITDTLKNLTRDDLAYVLVLNNQTIKSGNLKDIKADILYNGEIAKNKTDTYKLYIYVTNELKDISYKYSLSIIS